MDFPQVKKCVKCGATWFEGQLRWATGAPGTDADLAGLVCDQLPQEYIGLCINQQRGKKHAGDTWAKRAARMDEMEKEMKAQLDRLKDSGLE
jgi:hypothetical protein